MSLRRGVLNTTGMLLLAVAVFYSLEYWPQRAPLLPASKPAPHAANEPDYTITEFHAIDLDEQGRLRYELTAARLVHYPEPERAELVAPDMIFYRSESTHGPVVVAPAATGADDDVPADAQTAPPPVSTDPWQLTAATGRISDGGDRLDLSGDVKVARVTEAAGADVHMTMEAPTLTVFGRQQLATTDGPVSLRSAQAELRGVGMTIDMKHGQMHLKSQVRGHYDPQ